MCLLSAGIFLGLVNPSPVGSATPALAGEFAIETLPTDNGMPQNLVTALLQTRQGYLLVGTYNGLAEFDGDRSKVLDASNPKGLSDSRITALHDDPDSVGWIKGHLPNVLRRS